MPDQILWKHDPPAARDYATTHARHNQPPHWLRCEFMKDGERCIHGEGHTDRHEAEKPKDTDA